MSKKHFYKFRIAGLLILMMAIPLLNVCQAAPQRKIISSSFEFVVGIKPDLTVVKVGTNPFGPEIDVSGWQNIIDIAAGRYHVAGLKLDGTVVASGYNEEGQCNVGQWTDIVQVAAGYGTTLGIKSNGTVISTNADYDISHWRNIVQVAVLYTIPIGLDDRGRVFCPQNGGSITEWQDIVEISIRDMNDAMGLKSDGSVVTTSTINDPYVSNWEDIIHLAENGIAYGIKSDSIACSALCPDFTGWSNIRQITSSMNCFIGLKYNGSVVKQMGINPISGEPFEDDGRCQVEGWLLATHTPPPLSEGADLYLDFPLSSYTYETGGNIIAENNCTVEPGINASLVAGKSIYLKTGFHAKAGSLLTAVSGDGDGLPDSWEMTFFGATDCQKCGANDDFDEDGITNYQEFLYGTNPAGVGDFDMDKLDDAWEIENFGTIAVNPDADADQDGFSNYFEFISNTDPNDANSKPAGFSSTYEYDELGRIKSIKRVK